MAHKQLGMALLLNAMIALLAFPLAFSAPADASAPLELNYTTDPPGGIFGGVSCLAPVVIAWFVDSLSEKFRFARGCFIKDGDRFFIADDLADGQRVATNWRLTNGDRRGLCVNKTGSNYQWCDKDLPEQEGLQFRVGRCDGDTSACDTPDDYNHWSDWVDTQTT